MPSNKGVAYIKPGQAEVRNIEYPTFELKNGPGIYSATWAAPVNVR
jgi:glutathione-independent formaldehyde dehydrogenase